MSKINKYNPAIHHRESIRLHGFDYSLPGYYFITVCSHDRSYLFGQIVNNEMHLNEFGEIVFEEWNNSFTIRHELLPDEFIVMPNHFHGIVKLIDVPSVTQERHPRLISANASMHGNGGNPSEHYGVAYRPPKSISSFMAGVKSVITRKINLIRKTPGAYVFQSRFHDHIIRNNNDLFHIRQYIKNNPVNWKSDKFNSSICNSVSENNKIYEEESWMI